MPGKNEGVHILSPVSDSFERMYLKVRNKENRVYSDAEVREFPDTFFYNLHRQEWEMRYKSFSRLYQYLKKREKSARLLDLGCGNGWLAGRVANLENFEITGLDMNMYELEQAARVFQESNLSFAYGNIFDDIFPKGSFDYIIIASTIQYFPNLTQLINRCREFLVSEGEIHILDSPLYSEREREQARDRTFQYYQSLGCEEMAEHYFHHLASELSSFDLKYLYRPGGFFKKLLGRKDSPFPWIKILN